MFAVPCKRIANGAGNKPMKGHIRRRGKSSWAVVLYLGRDANGKEPHKWHSVRGTRRDAQRELAILHAEEADAVICLIVRFGSKTNIKEAIKRCRLNSDSRHVPRKPMSASAIWHTALHAPSDGEASNIVSLGFSVREAINSDKQPCNKLKCRQIAIG